MKREPVRRAATLKDIAAQTGFSVNTVSRALRGKDDISQSTQELIRKTALQLGYVNNMIASSLRLGYTNTIAVLLGDISNPHFAIMMKEIEEHARRLGYFSFLINTNEDEEVELQAIQSALNKNVDGIIICPTQQSEKNIRYLKSIGVPFVLIGRRFAQVETDYVICNDELGGYQATDLLIRQGHREILMLNGPGYISSAQERLAGYRRAHEEHGLAVEENRVREVPVTAGACAQVLEDLLHQRLTATAIFAFSDMVAWDMWSGLHRSGLRVPGDYSIIGFDHIQSRLALPVQLTSVSSYKARMSIFAVNALIGRMRGAGGGEYQKLVIDTKIAKGDTVAPPGSGQK